MSAFFGHLTIGTALGILLCALVVGLCIAEYLSPSNKDHHDHEN